MQSPTPHRVPSRAPLRILGIAGALTLAIAACGNDDGATVRDLSEGNGSGTAASGPASGPSDGGVIDLDATADGGYEYASDVSAHRLVTLDVCEVKELLGQDPPIDFDAVAEIYEGGGNSVNGDGTIRTLAGFATATDRNHGLDTYYGVPTPLDDQVRAALDASGDLADASAGARAQTIEKGLQNQVLVAWTIHELASALAKADEGDLDAADGAPHNWDEAWAFYHGAEPGCAPHATADSRAANFATTSDDGETSLVNVAILAAMTQGRDALLAGDVATAEAAADEVVRNLVITYSQAAIRYATLIPQDLAAGDVETAAEHRAEGLAFFRVIEAIVADAGADVDAINAIYDIDADTGTGDGVRAALEPAWSSLGITPGDIGVLG